MIVEFLNSGTKDLFIFILFVLFIKPLIKLFEII